MGCGSSTSAANKGAVGGGAHVAGAPGPDGDGDEPMTVAEIESRIESSDKTVSATFGGVKVRYAYLSQRGYYPDDANKPNQDSYSITHGFAGQQTDAFFAVYDGHGRDGDKCAHFCRDNLPDLVSKHVDKARKREAKLRGSGSAVSAAGSANPAVSTDSADKATSTTQPVLELTKDQTQTCSLRAHVECNRSMHRSSHLDDSLSGTTAISAYIHGRRNRITVSNVGDSRAILGQKTKRESSSGGSSGHGGTPSKKSLSRRGSSKLSDTASESSNSIHGSLRALPLSRDQTPYRRDERIRCRKTGARILSLDQIEGLEPINDEDELEGSEHPPGEGDLVLGEEIDEGGDPPRVWSPHGEYPGTAFTRSVGDAIAEELGVYAEPEMVTRELSPDDKIIVLASDGVFEFLTNQSVIDICAKFEDPLEACRAVVAESYELWLQYELRTDDITMICIFVDGVDQGLSKQYENMSMRVMDKRTVAAAKASLTKAGTSPTAEGGAGEKLPPRSPVEVQDDTVDAMLPSEPARPTRHHVSKEKTKALEQMKRRMIAERDMTDVAADDFDITTLYTEKSDTEKASIAEAIRASVMFQNVTDAQREMIFKVMEPIHVKTGDWVIKQGSVGDRFYIVDHGKFEVRIIPEGEEDKDGSGGNVVHVYVGSRETHAHPSFGELALMYSAPRAASIIAQTDGQLWGLHRHAFRKVLAEQSERRELLKTLRKIDTFRNLDREELENVAGSMEEATYGRGDTIVRQGDVGDAMYIICHGGHCERTEEVQGEEEAAKKKLLKANDYFGEEILGPAAGQCYVATVVATSNVPCWKLDRAAYKRTLHKIKAKRRGSSKHGSHGNVA